MSQEIKYAIVPAGEWLDVRRGRGRRPEYDAIVVHLLAGRTVAVCARPGQKPSTLASTVSMALRKRGCPHQLRTDVANNRVMVRAREPRP